MAYSIMKKKEAIQNWNWIYSKKIVLLYNNFISIFNFQLQFFFHFYFWRTFEIKFRKSLLVLSATASVHNSGYITETSDVLSYTYTQEF